MPLTEMTTPGQGGGVSSTKQGIITSISKTGGNTPLTITGLSGKCLGAFALIMYNNSVYVPTYVYNPDSGKLEYWYQGAHQSASDLSVTVTYGADSISISAFNISGSEKTLICLYDYAA